MKTFIDMPVSELQDVLDFKIKSLERAANTANSTMISDAYKTLVHQYRLARNSINQEQLPINKPKV